MPAMLRVRITPLSRQTGITDYPKGILAVRVSAPPVDGAANDAFIQLLVEAMRAPKSSIRIVSGHTSREKKFDFDTIAQTELDMRIEQHPVETLK